MAQAAHNQGLAGTVAPEITARALEKAGAAIEVRSATTGAYAGAKTGMDIAREHSDQLLELQHSQFVQQLGTAVVSGRQALERQGMAPDKIEAMSPVEIYRELQKTSKSAKQTAALKRMENTLQQAKEGEITEQTAEAITGKDFLATISQGTDTAFGAVSTLATRDDPRVRDAFNKHFTQAQDAGLRASTQFQFSRRQGVGYLNAALNTPEARALLRGQSGSALAGKLAETALPALLAADSSKDEDQFAAMEKALKPLTKDLGKADLHALAVLATEATQQGVADITGQDHRAYFEQFGDQTLARQKQKRDMVGWALGADEQMRGHGIGRLGFVSRVVEDFMTTNGTGEASKEFLKLLGGVAQPDAKKELEDFGKTWMRHGREASEIAAMPEGAAKAEAQKKFQEETDRDAKFSASLTAGLLGITERANITPAQKEETKTALDVSKEKSEMSKKLDEREAANKASARDEHEKQAGQQMIDAERAVLEGGKDKNSPEYKSVMWDLQRRQASATADKAQLAELQKEEAALRSAAGDEAPESHGSTDTGKDFDAAEKAATQEKQRDKPGDQKPESAAPSAGPEPAAQAMSEKAQEKGGTNAAMPRTLAVTITGTLTVDGKPAHVAMEGTGLTGPETGHD